MKKHYLRKTFDSWSAGTQVEILNWPGSPSVFEQPEGTLEVRVLAGNEPVLEVPEDIVIERRDRSK